MIARLPTLPGLLLTVLALAVPAHASAADVSSEADGFDWRGVWLGAYLGHGAFEGSGPFGGAGLGYDLQFGPVVVGVMADVSAGDLDASRAGGRYDLQSFGTVRARVGYAFERFVAYGTAGAAFASAEFARGGQRDTRAHAGWVVGAGLEAALFGGLTARVEYLYVDLDRRSFDANGDVGFDPAGGQVRVGLNYRF